MILRWKDAYHGTLDFEPGTLAIDFLPVLQRLPQRLQWWHQKLAPLVDRESALHRAFLMALRKAVEQDKAPDCFGKMLLEVGYALLPIVG